MKKELLMGVTAASFLAVSIAGNALQMNHETKLAQANQKIQIEMHTQEMALQKQLVVQLTQKQTAAPIVSNIIEEEFKITEVKPESKTNTVYVRGEKTQGTGEGIYYPLSTFVRFGLDNVKVGDVVKIGWTDYDYNNENWDNVAAIDKMK